MQKEIIEKNESKNKHKTVFIVGITIIIMTFFLVILRLIINSLFTCEIVLDGVLYCDMPQWLQDVEVIIWMLEHIFIPASIISFIVLIFYPIKANKKLKNDANNKN